MYSAVFPMPDILLVLPHVSSAASQDAGLIAARVLALVVFVDELGRRVLELSFVLWVDDD
jgi:hypothetical protein